MRGREIPPFSGTHVLENEGEWKPCFRLAISKKTMEGFFEVLLAQNSLQLLKVLCTDPGQFIRSNEVMIHFFYPRSHKPHMAELTSDASPSEPDH